MPEFLPGRVIFSRYFCLRAVHSFLAGVAQVLKRDPHSRRACSSLTFESESALKVVSSGHRLRFIEGARVAHCSFIVLLFHFSGGLEFHLRTEFLGLFGDNRGTATQK